MSTKADRQIDIEQFLSNLPTAEGKDKQEHNMD
jgi:hypothetical protein